MPNNQIIINICFTGDSTVTLDPGSHCAPHGVGLVIALVNAWDIIFL